MANNLYPTDISGAAWKRIAPLWPAERPGGRPRTTDLRAVLNAIFYLLRTGCQWRLLPREYPVGGTVYHYFRTWKNEGVWARLQRILYRRLRKAAGRAACPSVVIMDGQSVRNPCHVAPFVRCDHIHAGALCGARQDRRIQGAMQLQRRVHQRLLHLLDEEVSLQAQCRTVRA